MALISWFKGHHVDRREQSERALMIATELDNLPLQFSAKFMLGSARGTGDQGARSTCSANCAMPSAARSSRRLGAAALPIPRPQLPGLVHDGGGPLRRRTGSPSRRWRSPRARANPTRAAGPAGLGRNLLKLGRYRDAADCLQVAVNLIDQYGYDPALPHVVGLLASALARREKRQKPVGSSRLGWRAACRTAPAGSSSTT